MMHGPSISKKLMRILGSENLETARSAAVVFLLPAAGLFSAHESHIVYTHQAVLPRAREKLKGCRR